MKATSEKCGNTSKIVIRLTPRETARNTRVNGPGQRKNSQYMLTAARLRARYLTGNPQEHY